MTTKLASKLLVHLQTISGQIGEIELKKRVLTAKLSRCHSPKELDNIKTQSIILNSELDNINTCIDFLNEVGDEMLAAA